MVKSTGFNLTTEEEDVAAFRAQLTAAIRGTRDGLRLLAQELDLSETFLREVAEGDKTPVASRRSEILDSALKLGEP